MEMCEKCARLLDNCRCYNGPEIKKGGVDRICPCPEIIELRKKLSDAENELEQIRINGDY